jgi:peptidoglycan/LPS O-acetylase OafA/YrhL
MVFAWHFTHAGNGYPVPFEYVPALFPFALLDEGHTGVALFMTLSGYLFAKLLDGKTIHYKRFLRNRALRLLPLLLTVLFIIGVRKLIRGESLFLYASSIASGVVSPSLPNGGWSLTVEAHYYLILPLFLWMLRKSKWLPISIVVAAIALRLLIHHERGEVQSLAYWTIVGRIDQFALGMLIYQFRAAFARRPLLAAATFLAFAIFYWQFDSAGGFYQNPSYPSPSRLWIFLPTIEGIAYAVGIAWYDGSFAPASTGPSKWIGRIGEFSYSIYLLHFFFVFNFARFVDRYIMDLSNFYVASLWSLASFLLMVPIGYLSFRFIEAPFLKFRKPYTSTLPGPLTGLGEVEVEGNIGSS